MTNYYNPSANPLASLNTQTAPLSAALGGFQQGSDMYNKIAGNNAQQDYANGDNSALRRVAAYNPNEFAQMQQGQNLQQLAAEKQMQMQSSLINAVANGLAAAKDSEAAKAFYDTMLQVWHANGQEMPDDPDLQAFTPRTTAKIMDVQRALPQNLMSGNAPSGVKEYQYYMSLPEAQRPTYLEVKRNPQYLNAGDRFVSPTTGETITKGAPPQDMPEFKGAQAEAQKKAELQAQAKADLPSILANAENITQTLKGTLASPGLDANFGMLGVIPNRPGSEASGADAFLKQIEGEAFLNAYDQLRGGGSITEVEGAKATSAKIRMQKAQSAKDFRIAANDFLAVIEKGVKTAKTKAGITSNADVPIDQNEPAAGSVNLPEPPVINGLQNPDKPKAAATPKFSSPEAIGKAYQSGQITKEQAKKLLKENHGMN